MSCKLHVFVDTHAKIVATCWLSRISSLLFEWRRAAVITKDQFEVEVVEYFECRKESGCAPQILPSPNKATGDLGEGSFTIATTADHRTFTKSSTADERKCFAIIAQETVCSASISSSVQSLLDGDLPRLLDHASTCTLLLILPNSKVAPSAPIELLAYLYTSLFLNQSRVAGTTICTGRSGSPWCSHILHQTVTSHKAAVLFSVVLSCEIFW